MEYYNLIITIIYLLILLFFVLKYRKLAKENQEINKITENTLDKADGLINLIKEDQENFIKFIMGVKDKLGLELPKGKFEKNELVALLKKRIEVLSINKDRYKNEKIKKEKELEKFIKEQETKIENIDKTTIKNLKAKDLVINANIEKIKEKNKLIQKKDQKLLYYKRRAKTFIGQCNYNKKVDTFIKTLAGENPGVNKKAKNNLKNKQK